MNILPLNGLGLVQRETNGAISVPLLLLALLVPDEGEVSEGIVLDPKDNIVRRVGLDPEKYGVGPVQVQINHPQIAVPKLQVQR